MVGLMDKVVLGAGLGAAKGYGDAMTAQGVQKRQAMMSRLQNEDKFRLSMLELGARESMQRARDDRNFERNQDQIVAVQTDDLGGIFTVSRGGDVKDTGRKGRPKGLMNDNQIFDDIRKAYTTTDPMTLEKATDWKAFDAHLRDIGRSDLTSMIPPQHRGTGQSSINNGFDDATAMERVNAEASDRDPVGPNWMRPGATKEAYDGLTEEEWKTKRFQELRNGKSSDAVNTAPQNKQTQQASASSPYRGNTPPPGYPEAKQAKDGNWYVPNGKGGWLLVSGGVTDQDVNAALRNGHKTD